jgi:hypothetical protein
MREDAAQHGLLGPAMSGMLIADRATLSYPAICAGMCLLAVAVAWCLGRLLAGRPRHPVTG